MLKNLTGIATSLLAIFLLAACGASKTAQMNRIYLQGVDSLNNTTVKVHQLYIHKGDLLTILVYSDNREATEIYNQPQSGGGAGSGGGVQGVSMGSGRGYLVDTYGEIYFHELGNIKADGLTKQQLADSISIMLTPFLKRPYVVVRYANSKFTILGEVNKPGEIQIPDERLSIFDAIGLAGDLTVYGKRDNIVLVREEAGLRKVMHIDLRMANIYDKEFFYVQQNDLIYVEPTRKKPTGNEQILMRNIAVTASVLSTLALVISLITR